MIGQLDDVLIAGIAVWWFLRVCPPELALDEIGRLEGTPLGPVARALPWMIGVLLGSLALVALILLVRRYA